MMTRKETRLMVANWIGLLYLVWLASLPLTGWFVAATGVAWGTAAMVPCLIIPMVFVFIILCIAIGRST